jgi:FkbM family methyltransferase
MDELKIKIKKELIYRPNTADFEIVFDEIVLQDMYNIELLRNFEKYEPFICIDAGAHIGIFSKYFSDLFPNSEVHAFEPNPENFNFLIQNISHNSRVVPYNKGLSLKNDKINLYPSKNEFDTGSWTMVPSDSHKKSNSIEVEIINLEEFIDSLDLTGKKLLLKIDLEGYEANILNNLNQSVFKKLEWVFIEEHHIKINHNKLEDLGFVNILNPFGSKRHFVYFNASSLDPYVVDLIRFSFISMQKTWESKYSRLLEKSRITPQNLLKSLLNKLATLK